MPSKTPASFTKSKLFEQIRESFLNLFVPSSCHLCNKSTPALHYICTDCRQRHFPSPHIHQCQRCGAFYPDAPSHLDSCDECYGHSFRFTRNLSALPYRGKLQDIMLAYKFGRKIHLCRLLAAEILAKVESQNLPTKNVVITFVPIHDRRFAERKFNQAEEIARIIAKELQLPCLRLLKKTIHTKAQAQLDLQERIKNINGAFAPVYHQLDKLQTPTSIWLIDDVFTTGSTVNECSRILMKNKKVTRVTTITAFHG